MNSNNLRELHQLTNNILSESTQSEEYFMDNWPYSSPYLKEDNSSIEKTNIESVLSTQHNNSFDMFDIVSEFIVSEGYTEEEALHIMANADSDLMDEIFENIAARAANAVKNQRQGYHGDNHALDSLQKSAQTSIKKLTKTKGPKVMPGMPGV